MWVLSEFFGRLYSRPDPRHAGMDVLRDALDDTQLCASDSQIVFLAGRLQHNRG